MGDERTVSVTAAHLHSEPSDTGYVELTITRGFYGRQGSIDKADIPEWAIKALQDWLNR